VRIATDGGARALARRLLAGPEVDSVGIADCQIEVETSDPSALARALPSAAREADALLAEVQPVGDDLESVYAYLHARARGQGR
jgi:phage terminase large subunit-like protein